MRRYNRGVRREDFFYELPEDLIAQSPLAERSASRLLVLDGLMGAIGDHSIRDLPGYLRPGDLLVFNDTRVVAARLVGTKSSGGRVEIFLERALAGCEALAQLRASKPVRDGLEISTAGGVVRVLGRQDDLWRIELPGAALDFFERWGAVPLPPYIHRPVNETDQERYQSIFARERGAVAAPTASLHFDAPLVERLDALGVRRALVTLHVGAGTFQPLRTDDLDAHKMHAERVSVSRDTWDAIQHTHSAGNRVVAVGTTVVRALESAALELAAANPVPRRAVAETSVSSDQAMRDMTASPASTLLDAAAAPDAGAHLSTAWSGETRLFIRPGFEFQVVNAMVTNFHLPESTLLMLVSAFAGRENVLAAYAHAVRERYRFFSYGDAMFLTPAQPKKVTLQPARGTS